MTGSMAIGGYGFANSYSTYGMSRAAGTTAQGNASTQGNASARGSANPDDQIKAGRKSSPGECKTCKSRKYQDGSNESDVSFKAANSRFSRIKINKSINRAVGYTAIF